MKLDQVLTCFDYLDYEKVRMSSETSYIGKLLNGGGGTNDLKIELRSRFVLASYARDIYKRLQCMYQGFKSMEEYHKDMEVALIS
ncbi:hypothetical protein CR513_60085, partial [Mucuna pruriens]